MDCDDSQREVFLNHIKQACLEENNKICVNSPAITKVGRLANQIIHYVYLVVIIPDCRYHQSSE